ncbi:hypothetical protein P43SY_009282 [Pythium insidiosum]|uniref:1,3-beta-glucan synthase n=1 Tax=Pythium insidiosum TaxID=114742 RepID=A0AAD5LY57_PYTIN|nr:hypothetical protein P43SY_009282 [Pythium insidiosum]
MKPLEKHAAADGPARPSAAARQHSTTMHRRRAASNYQGLEEQVVERQRRITTVPDDKAASSAATFDLLQAKFGFQDGSVRNQREHLDSWVLNIESRLTAQDPDEALRHIHTKFFKNYRRWCQFLRTPPHLTDSHGSVERQIALFLLIWGEAANLRFMPECLCFLYHSMAAKLEGLDKLPSVPEGSFLRRVVRPLYLVVAKMRDATGNRKTLDHKNVTNYDDVNEFFWSPRCLDFDELNVAEAIGGQKEHKTFKERRSFFNPLLAFFRIYYFLFVMFHVLVAIAYVAYRTEPERHAGFHFYGNFFSPIFKDLRSHAFYSVFLSISAYAAALFARLLWHSIFLGLFAIINAAPYEKLLGDNDMLSMAPVLIGAYIIPVALSSFLQMFCKSTIWTVSVLNALDGTHQQYVGRNMGQSWGNVLMYGLFWSILFILKFLFNLQLMIKPLIGPSIEIFDIRVTGRQVKNGIIESDHNLAYLASMWLPVFLVYIYDSQIWLAIMQSIVGVFIGLRMKIGHSSRIPEFLPGNPLVGEGKPENQNVAMPFTRGEYVQTIDMNQEHYFEEALKIPNFLATGTSNGKECGKGRDVTLSQINAFEAKLSNGSAESSLTRDAHRMGSGMDFFRLNSMFYGHMGFYICNALTVLCVFVYSYAKLYIALHPEVQRAAIEKTNALDDLAEVLNTQFIFQFGMLMTIPLIATMFVEYGWRQALVNFVELVITLGPVFYIFETGTKAHFFDVAIMRGGSKYRGTGRGFAIVRETLVSFFKEYSASHYRKAVELLGLMIMFGIYGNFSIGAGALDEWCTLTNCTEDDPIPDNVTQKHDVADEMENIKAAFTDKSNRVSIPFRVILVFFLQVTLLGIKPERLEKETTRISSPLLPKANYFVAP